MLTVITSAIALVLVYTIGKPLCRYIEQGKEDDSDLRL